MTDRRRDPLPEGYQFGDAGKARVDLFRLMMDIPLEFVEAFGIGIVTKPFTTNRDLGDEA